MTIRLKNGIKFVKKYDLWGTLKKRIFKTKRYKHVKYMYLKYIRFFIKKPKKRIKHLLEKKKPSFFESFLVGWKKRRSYFKRLIRKNRKIFNIRVKKIGGVYGKRGRLVFELKKFRAFFFPKIRERKLKRYFQTRKHIFNHSLDNLVYHFEGMLGILLMRMNFFYSFYGLKRILKHGLIKINNQTVKSCFYFFLLKDVLTFDETFFFYLKKKFFRNLKKRSSISLIPSFIEVNYRFLWFFFYKYPEYSKNYSYTTSDIRYKFFTPSWLNMARNVSRF